MSEIKTKEAAYTILNPDWVIEFHALSLTVHDVQPDPDRREIGRFAGVVSGVRLDHALDGEGADARVVRDRLVSRREPARADHHRVVVIPAMQSARVKSIDI